MQRLFGSGRKKVSIEETTRALDSTIENLDGRSNSIRAKIAQIEQDLHKQVKAIDSFASATARNRALQLLKQKKIYEEQLVNIEERQIDAESSLAVVSTMKLASKDLKRQLEEIDSTKLAVSQVPNQ
ncbi:hypothetical protein DI09_67p130 [Mitosporidium daphniae]|uniref:Uncharacterized protein n=1 Tax=Mitosporidium daphniae TaxID=1485682 RepID=A0A098VNI9_9MICR|nr:uncharacterized protein DI09_67p130 [Mitosporidium daphniae]KGG50525.1 hypothetical protein DI09_67p130 [Mitosporidium daphniae]|eukprot:XP_013236952.1 uncharacterized protein DI09_67p130 [Mitosporidium daphniae]